MKHLTGLSCFFLFVLFLSTTASVVAQDYSPSALEGANWIILDSETPHWPSSHFVRTFEGDTVVNGLTYKKYYQYIIDYVEVQFGPEFEEPYELLPGRELIALVREDVATRRVYGIVSNFSDLQGSSTEDALIHDYSLGIGDTLVGLSFSTSSPLIVEEVGTEMHFGVERRFQKAGGFTFYEGVGSPQYGPTSGGSLFQTNGSSKRLIDYCTGTFAGCKIISSNVSLPGNVDIAVFPNPFTDLIHLELPNGAPASHIDATLRNLTGRVFRTAKLTANLNWSVADVPAGVYLVTLSDGLRSQTLKLIKR